MKGFLGARSDEKEMKIKDKSFLRFTECLPQNMLHKLGQCSLKGRLSWTQDQ